jgi:UDP-N-acetyl-D-glucosamine dehydrogenase
LTTALVVIGLGYVGLPLAQEATRQGMDVIGLDTSDSVVRGLNEGRSHVDDLEDADVARMLAAGFRATTDSSVLVNCDVAVLCVPTPLAEGGGPDLTAVAAAGEVVARFARPGMLVILESTTYPGTTEELLAPMLERRGLRVGTDIHLAFSPERIDPGNAKFGLRNTPKVAGGVTAACTQAAVDFYEQIVEVVVPAKGTREAEMAKLLENTYRHINIALVNEMAKFCHELAIDLWDVIRCASTKPFGFQPFYPGPGVGGHCIPIDPNYLGYQVKARLGYPFRFVELAEEINASMPAYVCRRIQDELNDRGRPLNGARVLLLGVTYKPDIADQRESPAVPLAYQLEKMGAVVEFHDPLVEVWHLRGGTKNRVRSLPESLAEADIAVLLQHHGSYDYEELEDQAKCIFDTRGVLAGEGVSRL